MRYRNFLWALAIFFALWIVFNQFPALDLVTSSWFYQNGEWLGRKAPFSTLREIYYNGSLIFGVYVALMAIVSFFPRRADTIVPRFFYRFFSLMAILGNSIIVNNLFKDYFTRARPYKAQPFGGTAEFTPARFSPAHQCSENCSFVSGEASGAMIMILAGLALCGQNKRARIWVWIVFLPMAMMRVMAGKHFLSDVVLSMVLMVALYWLFLLLAKRQSRDLETSFRALGQDFLNLFRRTPRTPPEA